MLSLLVLVLLFTIHIWTSISNANMSILDNPTTTKTLTTYKSILTSTLTAFTATLDGLATRLVSIYTIPTNATRKPLDTNIANDKSYPVIALITKNSSITTTKKTQTPHKPRHAAPHVLGGPTGGYQCAVM
jgi:hypothetical protein